MRSMPRRDGRCGNSMSSPTPARRGRRGPRHRRRIPRPAARQRPPITAVTTLENVNVPLSSERWTRFCPGSQGGVEWNGPAYHRASGTIYVNVIDWCTSVKLQRLDTLHGAPGQPWTGMDDPQLAFGKLDPPDRWKGWVTGMDAETGAIRWNLQTPKPMVAGITATADGLAFTGNL